MESSILDLRLANIEDLVKYKKEIIEMLDYSVRVNQTLSETAGVAKYHKLINYFAQGKTKVWLAFDGNSLLGYAQYFQKVSG